MYKKGAVIAEGKTKIIFAEKTRQDTVIIESKDDITKNDDPSQTKQLSSKAVFSTITTSRVFELLNKAGIPTAYAEQIGPREFVARKCQMIPLEVVARRYAVGSYLKRHPNLEKGKDNVPHRFHRLEVELFLKTTGGKFTALDGKSYVDLITDLTTNKPLDDPLILTPLQKEIDWILANPKIPSWQDYSNLSYRIHQKDVLPEDVTAEEIMDITRKVFLLLEGAWAQLGCRLIDFKIEFGIDANGRLVVADVIDNDSWRLRTSDWKELSKQLFRDNADFDMITEKYSMVAKLVDLMKFPDQTIVFWRGSKEDALPKIDFNLPGINILDTVKSGHKAPATSCERLEAVLAAYPEGGVIITLVGMSNGLGPILSARTSWPVIGVTITSDAHPEDAWSSLRMPSRVPMMTMLSFENAVLAALNILAQKNPAAYMHRQFAIEELGK